MDVRQNLAINIFGGHSCVLWLLVERVERYSKAPPVFKVELRYL